MSNDDRTDTTDGIEARLRRLLERADRLGATTHRRTIRGDSYTIDVGLRINSLTRAGTPREESKRHGSHSRARSIGEYHVACHNGTDEATVTVDLDGEPATPPTVRVEDGSLVFWRDGRPVERVALPFDEGTVSETSLNNGVLTVRVVAAPDGGDDGS